MRHFIPVLLCLLSAAPAHAKKWTNLEERKFSVYLMGDAHYASSKADTVTGGLYSRKMNNPLVGAAGIGYRLFRVFYLGLRYEYWLADRKLSFNNVGQTDTLGFQAVGGELGYYAGNPRVYYISSLGVYYPLALEMNSTRNGSFTVKPVPLSYQGRLTLGIKFSSLVALQLEGGYRLVNFGNLQNGSTAFLPSGESLNLSGPFLGLGLAIHF